MLSYADRYQYFALSMLLYHCRNVPLKSIFVHRNLAPDAHFTTRSWIERIVILGASKPSKVTVKTTGECYIQYKFEILVGWFI